MSEIYNNFKKEECGLCAYYGSKRETSRGFFGNSIKVSDEKAFCSETGRETTCNRWCNRFARCGQAEAFLQEEESKKEQQRLKEENDKAMALLQEEQRKNEEQAYAIKREADRLEEQNRIAAMTVKEKREYFANKKREEEEKQILMEKIEAQNKENAIKRRQRKKIGIAIMIIFAIISVIFIIIGFSGNTALSITGFVILAIVVILGIRAFFHI